VDLVTSSSILPVFLGLLSLVLPGAPGSSRAETDIPPICIRASLDPAPVWTFHGIWLDADSPELVLADVAAGLLRIYDASGDEKRTLARPGTGPLDYEHPTKIWPLEHGALMSDGSRLLWLDDALEPVRSRDLDAAPMAPGGTVRMFFDWAATETRIFGIADARLPDGSWRSGFVSMSPEDPTEYTVLRQIPVADRREFDAYLMGYRHVSVLDGRGYFLAMREPPRILEAGTTGVVRWLTAFPPGFDKIPALPPHGGAASGEVRFRAYESARLPVGLYGWNGRLYVLTREPLDSRPDAGTRWSLTRIDPGKDRIEGSVVLPTHTEHVSLIPGPRYWAILEKGRVKHSGDQPIRSMLWIATSWIEGSDSRLADTGLTEDSCVGAGGP